MHSTECSQAEITGYDAVIMTGNQQRTICILPSTAVFV